MKKLAIIYHSAHGHTEHIAAQILEGANSMPNIEVHMLKAEDLTQTPDELLKYDGYILGSPTCFGSVSGTFKTFMDATGRLWLTQKLKGELAAGFTVSSLSSGDKQSTLMSMFVFCMQHSMLWPGNPILPEQHTGVPYDKAANRLGSRSGRMAEASLSAPADSFPAGIIKTARMFGKKFSEALRRVSGTGLTIADNLEALT